MARRDGLADCVVCSPPYVSGGHHTDVMGAWNANGGGHGVTKENAGYGTSAGQLGAMSPGTPTETATMTDVETLDWPMHLAYGDGWSDQELVPEAFAHPAKAAKGLLRLIFDDLFRRGELAKGDLCLDPFGGIGSTGIEAASRGCRAVCCELEPKFHALMLANFDLHRRTWEAAGDFLPVAICGDSRRLASLIGPALAECAVSSPPYAESLSAVGNKPDHEHKQRLATAAGHGKLGGGQLKNTQDGYGTTPGQLGALPPGTPPADCAVSSHLDTQGNRDTMTSAQEAEESCGPVKTAELKSLAGAGIASPAPRSTSAKPSRGGRKRRSIEQGSQPLSTEPPCRTTADQSTSVGVAAGNLGAASLGESAAVPPSNGTAASASGAVESGPSKSTTSRTRTRRAACGTTPSTTSKRSATSATCDTTDATSTTPCVPSAEQSARPEVRKPAAPTPAAANQNSALSGDSTPSDRPESTEPDSFWAAARQIVRQTRLCLRDGAMTAWIVKSYVKAKKRVDFPSQWAALLESEGFVVERIARAHLVQETREPGLFSAGQLEGSGLTVTGDTVTNDKGDVVMKAGKMIKGKARKSFFRRLAEKKGSPRIDFEVVLFARKVGPGGNGDCAVSSPPWADTVGAQDTEWMKKHAHELPGSWQAQSGKPGIVGPSLTGGGYGTTPGQLGGMKPGEAPDTNQKETT